MRKLLFFISIFCVQLARGTTFTVTSPLDNGTTGTLRWAIESANANDPAAGVDRIIFNIPSASPFAHVIQLNSELPILTSNIIIDGTTQPLGAPFGPTDARIILTPKAFNNCKRGLVIRDADNIEIYGLYFAGFISKTPLVAETWSDGIFMCNVNHVIIGAPGKGNAFTLNYHSIRCDALYENGNPLPTAISSDVIIQHNSIGKNYTGQVAPIDGVFAGVELRSIHNVLVGGYANDEANQFMVFSVAVQIVLKTTTPALLSSIGIVNNVFTVGASTIPLPVQFPISGIEVADLDLNSQGNHGINISGNNINQYVNGIQLTNLKHPFNIVRNTIDCDRIHNTYPVSAGIQISLCDSGSIGGIDSLNTVRYSKTAGILLTASKNIRVSRDSIYCNPKGISIVAPAITIPVINDMLVNSSLAVNGKTCGHCIIEIFSTADCAAEVYNGEAFIGTSVANSNGDWNYAGPVDCNTSYTVTNTANTSSGFSTAMNYVLDTSAVIKQDATCNQNNGFIHGIKIYSGVDFHWEDDLGNIINSIDTNLNNLSPGFYKLVCSKQTLGCRISTGFYQIRNIVPTINTAGVILIHPSPECRVTGSITGITMTSPDPTLFSYRWVNQLGVPVGNTLNLTNVPAGTYSLTVYVSFDPACTASAGPYILSDKPAPRFDLAALLITNATCGHANGSIAGIAIINAYALQQFRWFDDRGNLVSNTASLNNVPPGNYYLQYDDASPCPAITSPIFTIGNSGIVTIDAANVIIKPSGCTVIKGSITNINVTGANLYVWINTVSGAVVGNAPDLLLVPSGSYKLRAFDSNFGCSDSTAIFLVPITPVENLIVQSKVVKDETCSGSNGSISQLIFQNLLDGYTFKWIRPVQDTFATSLSISNLTANTYSLIALDSNGCVQSVLDQNIIDHPAPQLDENNVMVTSDTCTQLFGSVTGVNLTNGTAPFNYLWYRAPGNTLAGAGKDLKQLGAGNYYLLVKDANGCADTSSVFSVGDETPVIVPPVYDIVYAKRNMGAFIKPVNSSYGVFELYDSPLAAIPLSTNNTGVFRTIPLITDRDYWIRKLVGSCKSIKVKVHVFVIDFSKLYVPNAFTPNNDGINDLLKIKVFGKVVIDYFSIYSRWGQQVFLSGDIKNGWDGTSGGKLQPAGTYAWIIQGYDIDGTPLNLRGTVMLIR